MTHLSDRVARRRRPTPQPPPAPAASPRVVLHHAADHTAVVVTGEVDLVASPALADAADRVRGAAAPVVVDVSGVTFLDVEGLRALRALVPAGAPLRLRGCPPRVRLVLDAAERAGVARVSHDGAWTTVR